MSQQQLDSLIQMLKSQPLNPNLSVQETRAGFEQMAAMFPVAGDVKCEPVSAGGVKAEWVDAPGADRWMLQQGLKPSRIAVSGDSAGGGLTVATLVAIRDAKLAMPAAGVPISPWVDLEGIGDSMTTKAAVDPIVQKAGLLQMAQAYLAGKDPRTPLAAPLYADLSGLPPLLIQVGTAETLLDDASRLAERARKAGVQVTYEPWENMIHVWHLFAPMLDEGQQAIERIGAFVQEHTA